MFSTRAGSKYTAVRESENEENIPHETFELSAKDRHPVWQTFVSTWFYCSATTACLFIFWWLANINAPVDASASPCVDAPVRREWRSLGQDEKRDFVRAFKCLSRTPSSWVQNRTVYDDFAFLHGGIGAWCHQSACFLPWHRYTLFTFEKVLKNHCGFRGQIPYWDWTLDWMNLANSTIFDSDTGFGGDGDANGPETFGEGRCVTTGPFTDLRPIIYNHTLVRHCLSRGFRYGNASGILPGRSYSPEKIGDIVRRNNYTHFIRGVEGVLHNTLHSLIRGDFKAMTAANDPLFFVHHAQLDRLWWKWQQDHPQTRLAEYRGFHMFNSTGEASLDDTLMFGGFTEDIAVRQAMNTEAGLLCYRY
ncbi:tyrosinase-like protein [Lasiosphaeria hispida]|uniref:Tyrosinase-like protein n=1 Tax=Lasiosphaeria hispida TaxID=260671 RepID=A0AAJ0HDQ0_9PEZI|nr:tyrosinase-like protein [Lasiosphaeria hispida]